MLIQVINLEKDKNRFDWMTKSLSDLGLSFIRVDAVRPDSIQGHDDRYTALLNQGLFPGEICCSLSHLQSWQNLVNSKDEFGVILEDDVHLSADFSIVIDHICRQYKEFGDRPVVVKLETFYATVTSGIKEHKITDQRHASELFSNHGGGAGYVLNRLTAEHLIDMFCKFSHAIDTELFHPEHRGSKILAAYQVFPACVIQDHKTLKPTFSSNIPKRLSVPQKRNTLLLRLKALIKPLYLVGYNLYLLPKGQRRVQVEYR